MRESSGGRASSLVWPRDLAPPTELVLSDLRKYRSVSVYTISETALPPVGFLLGFPGCESVGQLGRVDAIAGRFLNSYSGSINYSIGVVCEAPV